MKTTRTICASQLTKDADVFVSFSAKTMVPYVIIRFVVTVIRVSIAMSKNNYLQFSAMTMQSIADGSGQARFQGNAFAVLQAIKASVLD
jgi:hypothetical protein